MHGDPFQSIIRTKVDQDRGGHLTVPSILTLRSNGGKTLFLNEKIYF